MASQRQLKKRSKEQSDSILVWRHDEYHPSLLGVFTSIEAFIKSYCRRNDVRLIDRKVKGSFVTAKFDDSGVPFSEKFRFEAVVIDKVI